MKSALGLAFITAEEAWHKIPEIVKGAIVAFVLMALFIGLIAWLTPEGYGVNK